MFSNELSQYAKPEPGAAVLIGTEAIRAALKTIPPSPGVYRMLAADDKILYIGKAKNLFNRVGSYANARDLSATKMRMVAQVARVEVTITKSEAEALLVEANFVRKYRPRYNILLKDDKSFPALRIATDHAFPRIEKHRGAQNKPGEYFGPYASVGALNETLALLQRIFLLRPCADTVFKNRTRPCLQYQIKRCSAPCVSYVTEEAYREQLTRARDFLHGRHRDVQELLANEMRNASEAMDYEKAALLRDRIRALTQVQQEQGLRVAGLSEADVIALARKGGRSTVMVSFYRQGSHFGQQSFHPTHEAEASDGEVMAAFLAQFYQSHTPPHEILVNLLPEVSAASEEVSTTTALLEEALGVNVGYKLTIRLPQRGDKLALVREVEANAEASLARSEMERATLRKNLQRVKELFALKQDPARIEVYDNSHIMGTNAVGAFIVATPEGFDKRSYRTFNIKDTTLTPGDDYGMMREVFTRRFKNANADTMPDLVLVDGGLGQLNAVKAVFDELKVAGVTLVSIAKGEDRNAGREWFFMPGISPFQLPPNDPVLHYLQRLRDEAHRFAIGRHRNKRSGSFTASALDDIPGIGGTRKKALLQHFGSRVGVERATLAELENVAGISKKTARSIYDYFHQ